MNWQEVLKKLRDIFAYADVQSVVYTLEKNGVHAMSAEGDAEFYADGEKERYTQGCFLENNDLETDLLMDSKFWQSTCDEQLPVLRKKDHKKRLLDHYLQYQPKELTNYLMEFNFQYSDLTDEEVLLLIGMLVDARDVYSQHNFDVGKTPQKFHISPHVKKNPMLNWNDNDLPNSCTLQGEPGKISHTNKGRRYHSWKGWRREDGIAIC